MKAERPELVSWKEISSYLGISVKTAQTWERERSLPVRRLPGPRSRVLAYPNEIDLWKSAHAALAATGAGPVAVATSPGVHGSRMLRRYAIASAALLLVIGGVWASLRFQRSAVPSSFRVDGNTLVVMAADNREVWRHTFPYALSHQTYLPSALEISPRAWFRSLHGAGSHDVLFVAQPPRQEASCTLYCFDEHGNERWRFTPGRAVHTRSKEFTAGYGIHQVVVGEVGRGHLQGILVSSYNYLYYPSQVVLLDPDGNIVREYWHSGHLGQLAIGDPSRTGYRKIYLGGVSNARHAATLVVLDPDNFGGASTEEQDYQLLGFSPGREVVRVFFPRSDMNQRTESYNGVAYLWVREQSITVDVHERFEQPGVPNIIYELTPELRVRQVTLGDQFRTHHRALEQQGVLDHEFGAPELALLHRLTVLPGAQ